jgi:hypothetical protein
VKVIYEAGWMNQPGGLYWKVTSSIRVTEPLRPVEPGVAVWTKEGKGATGAVITWQDVLRMAVLAAQHNPAARADLVAALAALPELEAAPAPVTP